MTKRNLAAAIAACLLAACSAQPAEDTEQRRPKQAGQPMDPLRTAGHITGARLAALTGDQAGIQRNANAMAEDLRLAMKLPDPNRRIDPEAARTIARHLHGVRAANWLDPNNFLVLVDGAHLRSPQTVDELCYRLEALGDTLAVVVHLQNAAPRNRDDMDTLSRNCQLAEGDRSMFVRDRRVDVLDPSVRAQHRADTEAVQQRRARQQREQDRAALESIPEM